MSGGPGAIGELDVETLLGSSLRAGLETLDQRSTFEFKKYVRTVIPVDGFVFWKPTGMKATVNGSLHFTQEWLQEEDQAIGYTRVIFTSEKQIQEFSQPGKNEIWVCTYKVQGKNAQDTFRFAFAAQTGFYTQASLWHYVGYQIPPALLPQLLDPPVSVDLTRAVVNNSIPLWLALNSYTPPYPGYANAIPIFPSFQAAENQAPPYIVVDVLDSDPLQAVPAIGVYGEHTQWVKDTCRLTAYGLQNNEALTFQDVINQYSLDTDNFGLMNAPVWKDVHRVQAEIHGIAMKKEMLIEISYDQQKTISTGHQLIKEALYDLFIGSFTPPPPQEEGLILIPYNISEQSLTGGAVLVAGILNDSLNGTTSQPVNWEKYAQNGTEQALNLITQLDAVNSGSGVDWSFLSAATLVELEWNVSIFLMTGEGSFDQGILGINVGTFDANGSAYSVPSLEAQTTLDPPPLAASTQIQLSCRTIAPVESGLIHVKAGILPLTVGANHFTQANSGFSVVCRVVGYQL